MTDSDIPVLHASGKTLALAYESAIIELWKNGTRIKSQYDKADDLPTVDASMSIVVEEPWQDPMIHKAFPGGVGDLREYVMELMGAKDSWVRDMTDGDDKRWEYTYHQRLANWGTWKAFKHKGGWVANPFDKPWQLVDVDQIAAVVDKLAEAPFTRRAQMITWMPFMDNEVSDPPCLQSLWYRVTEGRDCLRLNCDVRFRSNDAWGANFMNMFGLTHFNRNLIADPLQEKLGSRVELGRMWWVADSFHIYGKDQQAFKDRLWNRIVAAPIEDRTYNFFDPDIQEWWNEAEGQVKQKIADYEASQAAAERG